MNLWGVLLGEAESRFFLLDWMIGEVGGDKELCEGVARVDLEGVPRVAVGLDGVPKKIVDFEGVPMSFRGVVRTLVRLVTAETQLTGELPRSIGLTLNGVFPELSATFSFACDITSLAGVLLGVFKMDLIGVFRCGVGGCGAISHLILLVGEKKSSINPGVLPSFFGVPLVFLGVPRVFWGLSFLEANCASDPSPKEFNRRLNLFAGMSTSSSSSLFLLATRWGNREEAEIRLGALSVSGISTLPRIREAFRLSSNLLLARAPWVPW